MTPYVIFALPRSRTKWLSCFLTHSAWRCGHDELLHCRSLADVKSWLSQDDTGTVETAAAPFWSLLPPNVRVVTVRRPVEGVMGSLAKVLRFEPPVMRALIGRLDRKLDQLEARLPNVRRFEFDDLAQEETCAALFQHCLSLPHDHDWWQAHDSLNIQVNIQHELRYYTAHKPQLEKLARVAYHEIVRGMRRRPVQPPDGVTFQQETLHQAFTDPSAQWLMTQECAQLGEDPQAWRGMNLPLFERLEAKGNLHIFTARSNGRMFGYIVSAVGEAYHGRDQLEAEQVSFFAAPGWTGLGRKLQHAAIEDLRAQGVDRVMMFQPDSARVGLLYRRLGAQQTGQRYVLELG